jgi:DisA bacterial checkpoint controller nucleotide-binding
MQLPLHTYPRQLAERIWSTWINENRMHAAIDSVETLDAFLSVAYQASLLREETRQVECRIAMLGLELVDGPSMARIGFRLFRFTKPRIFAEQEIRRVAPATGFYRSMIAVQRGKNRAFEISGMIHTGEWSRDLTIGIDDINYPIPDWLIIHVRGPGNLVICRGADRIATLLNGRIEGHGFDLFTSSWLGQRYRKLGDGFVGRPVTSPHADIVVREDLVRNIGQSFLKRVIREIRNARHGGALVFVPRFLATPLLKSGGPLCAKYRIDEGCTESPFRMVLEDASRRLVQIALAKGRTSVGWKEYLQWYEELPFTYSQRFLELACWLSDLTAVDGCLLLDHEFTVLGFGVEIQIPGFEDEIVYQALDIEALECTLESVESAGTRHRAAYRLCREHDKCLAIVVSQDGAVKFVANHRQKVTYWNHLTF